MLNKMIPQHIRLINLLSANVGFSVVDICKRLHIADPRGVIRYAKKHGYNILSEWKTTEDGKRYKVYYYKPIYDLF